MESYTVAKYHQQYGCLWCYSLQTLEKAINYGKFDSEWFQVCHPDGTIQKYEFIKENQEWNIS